MLSKKERKGREEAQDQGFVHWTPEAQEWMTEGSTSGYGAEQQILTDWRPDWALESMDLRY